MSSIPVVSPGEVTPEWITAVLQHNRIDARVRALREESVGTGQLGETRRYYLDYAGTPPPAAPATVVGKFSSLDRTAAETGRSMGFYRSEVMFYREAASRAGIRVPSTYLAEIDPKTNDFTLVFEDLAPARSGNQMSGMTVEEARLALVEVAKLHAAFWNDEELAKQPWMYVPPGAQGFYTTELVESSWAYFKKEYPGMISREVHDVCERFVRNHAYWNRPRPSPKVYSHNDFRADNMLFGGADGRVCVVDWQTSAFLGTGMDIAYFLGGAFDLETRRANEKNLLTAYHESLIGNGVKDYSFDHMMDDYRHYSFAVLVVAIAATVIVKRTERGDRLFCYMITGGAQQALDNNALDLLPA